ncbi:MAG TPA: dihydrolipoyl dehydrogenase [Acidimicrobiales bacterium]|jgi:dihydrolipoamide dehydrogenase|nr:dihydrolipoyl dehydrogenase [Acidimicrobiales bacterium]
MTATDETQYDVVVIGGGPGGYATALYGAAAGLNVAIVERDKVGGTCLHRGCIPAKEFLETAAVYRTVVGAGEFGVQATQPTVDFSVSQARKNTVVSQLFRGLQGLLKSRKITTLSGTGTLLAGRRVRVVDGEDAGTEVTGRHVVLAAGSVPRSLPGLEVDGRLVLTSDEFLDLEELPPSVVIIGGGVIGCEFASLLSDLGTKVTVVEALESILLGCDQDVVPVVARSFRKRGIEVLTGVQVKGHTPRADGTGTTIQLGDGRELEASAVIVSVGRRPRTEGLLSEGAEVQLDERGFVLANHFQQTHEKHVWAVGDLVANAPQLAHVGFAEGILVIKGILGETMIPVDYERVPWAIYTHPEVAFAGLTEAQAAARGLDVVIKKDPFGGNSRARIIGDTDGLVKVIAERRPDGSTGAILGVHMVGPWVTELLGAGYLAVNWEATPEEVAHFVQPHPSLSETFGETVQALTGRGLHVG